mmetsp:Transcript_72385/g.136451  ORF Transcript_72385/g.136451 Transcript_72385/m.136451 type:complete len:99 (-) Transcript_72385:161-457(-)
MLEKNRSDKCEFLSRRKKRKSAAKAEQAAARAAKWKVQKAVKGAKAFLEARQERDNSVEKEKIKAGTKAEIAAAKASKRKAPEGAEDDAYKIPQNNIE